MNLPFVVHKNISGVSQQSGVLLNTWSHWGLVFTCKVEFVHPLYMDLPCLAIRLPATVNIVISICDLGASRDYKTLPDLPSHKGGYIMNVFFFFWGGWTYSLSILQLNAKTPLELYCVLFCDWKWLVPNRTLFTNVYPSLLKSTEPRKFPHVYKRWHYVFITHNGLYM